VGVGNPAEENVLSPESSLQLAPAYTGEPLCQDY
jgi:hypothetical protein